MALEKTTKTKEQNRLSAWIAAVVVGILIVVIMVACAGLFRRLHKNNERIAELESQIVYEEQRSSGLSTMEK